MTQHIVFEEQRQVTMLRTAMTWRLCGISIGTETLLIILSGYLFNLIL